MAPEGALTDGGGGALMRGMLLRLLDVDADRALVAVMEAGRPSAERLREGRPEAASVDALRTLAGKGGGRVPVKDEVNEALSTGMEGCIGEGLVTERSAPPDALQSKAPGASKEESCSANQSDREALRAEAVRGRFSSVIM